MGYIELNVTYMLNEREQKALEELLLKWQQTETKTGEKPFVDMTIPRLFNFIMMEGSKFDISKHIKNSQYQQGMIDSSELIGESGFLLSEERQEVKDRLQQMTLEEKVDFLENYEDMRSKDSSERTMSPVDVRLSEILSKEECGKIWENIRQNKLKPSHALVNAIGRLNALTGKKNDLWDIKWLAKNKGVSPEVKEVANEIMKEIHQQEMKKKSQSMSKQEKEAFIEGIEYAKDTCASIESLDLVLYDVLIEERRLDGFAARLKGKIDLNEFRVIRNKEQLDGKAKYYSDEYWRAGNRHYHWTRLYDSNFKPLEDVTVKYTNAIKELQRIARAADKDGIALEAYDLEKANDEFYFVKSNENAKELLKAAAEKVRHKR